MKPNPYTIWPLNLATAGNVTIRGPWAQIAFLEALNAGAQVSARITVRAGVESEDAVPMRPGTTFRNFETHSFYVEWEAQSGVTATLGLTNRPDQVDWNVPPVQPPATVTGTVATEEVPADTIVVTSNDIVQFTTLTVAARTARRSVVLQADISNTDALWVRHAGAGAFGYRLYAGASLILDMTAAVEVHNPSTGTKTALVIELYDA